MDQYNLNGFRRLIVWQKMKMLTVQIYHTLRGFPKEELYGLTSQMKRASVSVASNIAEGNQRRSSKDKIRFFNIAQGSLVELDCQLDIALELGFIEKGNYGKILEMINKTGFLLTRLIQSEIGKNNPTNPTSLANRTNPPLYG